MILIVANLQTDIVIILMLMVVFDIKPLGHVEWCSSTAKYTTLVLPKTHMSKLFLICFQSFYFNLFDF